MKITKSELQKIIKEVTQGEMEFAELEAARQNFIENRGDDEAISDLLYKVEQLVEPLMAEMGLFFEVQELLIHGEIVFTNDRNMEVRINPRGAMGRYDVQVNPLYEAHDSFDPVRISLDSMKGVVQYIKDEFIEELQRGGTYKQPPRGMVGEPEGQMELPLPMENKMRITKSQLERLVREEINNELEEAHCGSGNRDEDGGTKSTKKHDDHPALKGGQKKKLPDNLQKAIIKKSKMKEAVRQALTQQLMSENQIDEVFGGIGKAISKVFGGGKSKSKGAPKPAEKVTADKLVSDELLEIIKAGGGDISYSGAEPGEDKWSSLTQHRGAGNAESHAEILLSMMDDPGRLNRGDVASLEIDSNTRSDLIQAIKAAKGQARVASMPPFKLWGSWGAARKNSKHPFNYAAMTENSVNYMQQLQDFVDFLFRHAPGLLKKANINEPQPSPSEKNEAADIEKNRDNLVSYTLFTNI